MNQIKQKVTIFVLALLSFIFSTPTVIAQTAVLGATQGVQGESTNNTLLIIVGVVLAILALLGLLFILLRRRRQNTEA